MKSELNSKDYVTFARRFVKETVETLDYQELKSLVTDYIHDDLQRSYDDYGQVSVFETMDIEELRGIVTDHIHEEIQEGENTYGQDGAFEEMMAWREDVFLDVAKDFELEFEGV